MAARERIYMRQKSTSCHKEQMKRELLSFFVGGKEESRGNSRMTEIYSQEEKVEQLQKEQTVPN